MRRLFLVRKRVGSEDWVDSGLCRLRGAYYNHPVQASLEISTSFTPLQ
jgi:hypothetical protein